MASLSRVAIDTNVLVALVDRHDNWHSRALKLREALKVEAVPLVYFDLVLNETISVLARRGHEQRRADQFPALLNVLEAQVPESVLYGSLRT